MSTRSIASVAYMVTLIAGAWGPTIGADIHYRHHSSRVNTSRPKSRKMTTVAAMKRAAKRRRNRSKRHG